LIVVIENGLTPNKLKVALIKMDNDTTPQNTLMIAISLSLLKNQNKYKNGKDAKPIILPAPLVINL
jgi:hypothetical protein